jgi:hypothetical protein
MTWPRAGRWGRRPNGLVEAGCRESASVASAAGRRVLLVVWLVKLALDRSEDGGDFCGDGGEVGNGADGLVPGPPEGPAAVVGLLNVDALVELGSAGVGDLQAGLGGSAAGQFGGETLTGQFGAESFEMGESFLVRVHESRRLGLTERPDVTCVKSSESGV